MPTDSDFQQKMNGYTQQKVGVAEILQEALILKIADGIQEMALGKSMKSWEKNRMDMDFTILVAMYGNGVGILTLLNLSTKF